MEKVLATDGGLQIFCNTNIVINAKDEYFSSTLGNTTLPITDTTTVAEADIGATYVFLIDNSGSITANHLQQIKNTISEICATLTAQDNISIFVFGNELSTQSFVSDPEEIAAQIAALEQRSGHTNLYESINTSLAILNTHAQVHDKRTLVIFSDGEEYIVSGITYDEAIRATGDSHIPIYTSAMLGTNPSST
jgi:Mg-chelatase subunit ChlD